MDWFCKRFEELTVDELYEILRLRTNVFVVEQTCPYPELDGKDKRSVFLFAREGEPVIAGMRLYWKTDESGVMHMGRVVTARRGVGLGAELLRRGIALAFDGLGAEEIYIEAQEYAAYFYAREGFAVCSEPFLEDGISHVQMRLRREDRKEKKRK